MSSNKGPFFFVLKGESYFLKEEKKRGRPLKADAKRRSVTVRVDRTDEEKLDYLINDRGMTYTEIFKMGLKMTYNLKKYT